MPTAWGDLICWRERPAETMWQALTRAPAFKWFWGILAGLPIFPKTLEGE